jgi:hypothetical protein
MFLSKDDLKLAFGIDLDIAAYYVDRKVPEGNLYWKGRYLYVNTMPGFIFMPIYADLLRRCGIGKEQLLAGPYVELAEAIMHSASVQESQQTGMQEHLLDCLDMAASVSVNPYMLDALGSYFKYGVTVPGLKFGTPFRSLNRADAYLASLCTLRFDPSMTQHLLDAWYSMITFYLITDDLEDIRQDLKGNEDNAAIEAGLDEHGAELIEGMVQQAVAVMQGINPVLANRFEYKMAHIDIRSIILSFSQGR